MAPAVTFLHTDIVDFQLYLIPNYDVEFPENTKYNIMKCGHSPLVSTYTHKLLYYKSYRRIIAEHNVYII